MGWQDAPIVSSGSQPAWASAPIINAPASKVPDASKPEPSFGKQLLSGATTGFQSWGPTGAIGGIIPPIVHEAGKLYDEFGNYLGDKGQEFATAHGAPAEVAGGVGALGKITPDLATMFIGGGPTVKIAEKGASAAGDYLKTKITTASRLGRNFYDAWKGKIAKETGEAARSDVSKLAEQRISEESAKQAAIPGAIHAAPQTVLPVAGRDVASDMLHNVQNRTKELQDAIHQQRNALKEEWQNVARQKEISGQWFQGSPAALTFGKQLNVMEAKYISSPSVMREIKSIRNEIFGAKGHTPSFEAVETAQQNIRNVVDKMGASQQNLAQEFKVLSNSLNSAMSDFSPKYGEMLRQWPGWKSREENLTKLSKLAENYGKRLEFINSPSNAKEVISKSKKTIISLKNDGLIDLATKDKYITQIEEAQIKYGKHEAARDQARLAVKAAMTMSLGASGWWMYQVLHHHGE